jgi:demethylmenaquinone methyltransferase/2-methoxy-6-polyprenyl-1,4-benzoquinol methylase
MFDAIAGRYDLANHLLSVGLHLRWKRAAVRAARLRPGEVLLDACCGTADLAAAALAAGARVVAVDVAPRMLAAAARRLRHPTPRKPSVGTPPFPRPAQSSGRILGGLRRDGADDSPAHPRALPVRADVRRLPVADGTVDAVAVAFGLRNVVEPAEALAEFFRVLRPGGRLVVLEFGRPSRLLLRWLYDLYSTAVLVPVGGWLTGRADAYRYLRDSIRRWPPPAALADLLRRCGFDGVAYSVLTGGIAVLHTAHRPAAPADRAGGLRRPA